MFHQKDDNLRLDLGFNLFIFFFPTITTFTLFTFESSFAEMDREREVLLPQKKEENET